eukprot:TRINITY_DN1648_c0_g3_i1.p2 TRINITY_DN1648_c0_g3~~TRINITY_DN1648_c0_g3_i1.p2  ORF type:complete len:264 (-),score=73.43 TRINITY_DN1648_c0_g3_i1:2506-3264(-)
MAAATTAAVAAGRKRVLLSWSSGKDCAWAMHLLRQQPDVELVALLTTFNESANRVAMHAVRRELAEAQAKAAGLPLWPVMLPSPCSGEEYETRMRALITRAQAAGITHSAFGDLHLRDVRAYREKQLEGTGIAPLFPLWGTKEDTPALARRMQAAGLQAIITCVDTKQLDPSFVGRAFDAALLSDLPPGVDPCGENGEFHTFCHAGPMFPSGGVAVRTGEIVHRDGYWFADVLPAASAAAAAVEARAVDGQS